MQYYENTSIWSIFNIFTSSTMEPSSETPVTTNPTETAPTTTNNHPYRVILLGVGGVIVGLCAGVFISALMNKDSEPEWKKTLTETNISDEAVENYEPDTANDWVEAPSLPFSGTTTDVISSLSIDQTDYSMYYRNLIVQDEVSWLPRPKVIEDQKIIFLNPTIFSDSYKVEYLTLGKIDGSTDIIRAVTPCTGMLCGEELITLLRKGTQFSILKKYSTIEDFSNLKDFGFNIRGDVTFDEVTTLKALDLTPIAYDKSTLEVITGYTGAPYLSTQSPLFEDSRRETSRFLSDTPLGPLFMTTRPIDGGVVREYHLRTAPGLWVKYELPINYIGDDAVPEINWLDGTNNTTYYRSSGIGGCGLGGATEQTTNPIDIADLSLTGTTSDGRSVYAIKNENHPLVTRVFEMTKGLVYEYQDGKSITYTITPTKFVAERGVLIIEDDLGYQNIFTHGKYGPQAECAKPVIYLYPEATTTVSVIVDALVTKSEPDYGSGWTTTAAPDGTLTMADGATYTSLFWDGYGRGEYPTLTNGFVVKTEDAISTMEEHLRTMGFNNTEIADFSEYWAPLMPTAPYTKFSWLQTREMDELARLTIEPKPHTVLRAFVDFTGLDTYENIEPQVLQSINREGYTVTEWGGLLRK